MATAGVSAALAIAVVGVTVFAPVHAAIPSAPGGVADSAGLDGIPIRRVEVTARNVFDPLPHGVLRPIAGLANHLHIRTRASTIRRDLLFAAGERWNEQRARESLRLLRARQIFVPVSLVRQRVNDSLEVRVETRDIWSTVLDFSLESGGGSTSGEFGVAERNLFGRGQSLAFSYREDPLRVTRSVSFSDPALGGTRLRVSAFARDESNGSGHGLELAVPFWAEDARWTGGVRWERGTTLARLYRDDIETAVFDRRDESTELWGGLGESRGGVVSRLIARFRAQDRRFGPTRVVAPVVDEAFLGGEENERIRRLSIEASWWRPRFVERRGIEQLSGIEDVDLGTRVVFEAGVSPRGLGGSRDEGLVRMSAASALSAAGGAFALGRAEASWRPDPRARDAVLRLRLRAVVPAHERGAFVFAALGVLGFDTPRDFQILLGGLDGLRAFPAQALAGTRVWRFNAERRWTMARDAFGIATLGAAVFYDAGHAWGAGSGDAGWHHDAGLGVRMALPGASPSQIVRVDLAWPIEPLDRGRRETVLSFGSSQAF
ncbi:MAG: BamA/TamA family outer membrane protein [Candidatus Eisenbacteria bacterium]|uniref:BamA/TamA family outer membrane protein n=1 Tax=Eiseniibacteriota bacterium TaxID=2212470 RepID=A0A849SP45_UNCEI|nr:BamA/TamA family outer membrane protein [Candidatus Eisenbacteria bacterium]